MIPRKGSIIRAKLIEAVDHDHWIVSFQGQLVQVLNNTDIPFEEGMLLNLQVIKEHPLQLKVHSRDKSQRTKLDVII